MEQLGTCKYCGQSKMIDTDAKEQDEIDEIVSQKCECEEAQLAKRVKLAQSEITRAFLSDKIEIGVILSAALSHIQKIDKVTVSSGNVKGTLEMSVKGIIKVKRHETYERTAEV